MRHLSPQSGKAAPLVLGLAVLGLLAFLLVVDPLGLGLLGGGDDTSTDGSTDLLGAEAPEDGSSESADAPATLGLAGRYGEGDLGAIRMRLIWMGTRSALAGQSVVLFDRAGTEVTKTPSDADGMVMFNQVRPARGYSLEIVGEGFSPVRLQGIKVHPQSTKDLGDIVLGKDVVLRGRVIDTDGRPVPGTAVSVNTIVRGLATKGMLVYMAEQAAAIPPPLQAATSDAEGYFTFSALDDGMYALLARHAGYASKQTSDVIVARERGADMLTVVLGEGATASGRVVGQDGKPIVGAQVMAVAGGRRMMMRTLQREMSITDSDGRYTIDTLSVGGSYRFGVVAKGYAPSYEVSETRVERELERDFTLVKGGNLTGVVTDETTGKPIHNARIAVYVGQMGFGGRAQPGAKASSDVRRSDEKGQFTFESLTPGPVSSAVVQAAGYVSGSFSQWPPPGNMWPAIEADQTTEVTVTLKRGATITGTVKTKTGAEPVQGAEITLMREGWAGMASMWIGTPNGISGADGAFKLEGVLPGKYRMLAMADGFSPPGGEQGVEVEVPENGGSIERNLELISAGVIEGVVRDSKGEPIAGVKIRMRAGPTEGAGGGRMQRGMNMARSMLMNGANPADLSDAEGRFRLEGVGTDTMWIVYGESSEYVSGETKAFKIAAGETKTVELEMLAGGSLRGTVLDENGQRMAGARVQVARLPEELRGQARLSSWEARRALRGETYVTDENGSFFADNLKPGLQLVRASKDGYITHFKRNLTIKAGEASEGYTIPLSKGETLEGVVLGHDGRPLRRATVSVTSDPNPGGESEEEDTGEASEDVEPTMFARTDDKGRFKVENIKPGTYNVVVWFASGHKGWMRDNSEAAMHRDVSIPGAGEQAFKLEKADPAAASGMPGGGRGRRGR